VDKLLEREGVKGKWGEIPKEESEEA